MLDFTDIDDEFERTQSLPALTRDTQLEEVLERERAARLEVVELFQQNIELVKDNARLKVRHRESLMALAHSFTHNTDGLASAEEMLFEVCGALKEALSKVLQECGQRQLALECGDAASRTLDRSCEKLEQILGGPGRDSPPYLVDGEPSHVPLAGSAPRVSRAERDADAPAETPRTSRVIHLEIVRPETLS